jgi:hypothetical protein
MDAGGAMVEVSSHHVKDRPGRSIAILCPQNRAPSQSILVPATTPSIAPL